MTTPFAICDRYVEQMVELVPQFATSIGDPRGADSWSHHGTEGAAALYRLARVTRAELEPHLDHVDLDQRTAARVLAELLDRRIESFEAGDHLEDLGHLASSFRGLRTTFDSMDQMSEPGWNAIAGRLERLPEVFEQYMSRLDEGRLAGRAVARRQVMSVIQQGRSLEGPDSAYERLVRTAGTAGFSSPRLESAARTARRAVSSFADYLQETYLPDSPERDGVGREKYERRAAGFLGMEIDADDTYEWGWDEFSRILTSMEALADQVLPGASFAAATDHLESTSELRANSPEEFCAIISDSLTDAVERLSGRHFDVDPRIRPISVSIAPPGGALGAYYMRPSEDFSRPGGVWYSVGDQTEFPVYHQISTAYHEGFPGHHLQVGTAMAHSDRLSRAHRLAVWYPG